MQCPTCRSTNPYAATFCLNCGQRFEVQQPQFSGFTASPQNLKTGLAVTSLVLGILSVITIGFLGILSILGLILGIVALAKVKNNPMIYGGKNLALGGVITNGIGLLLGIVIVIMAAIALPSVMRQAARMNEVMTISNIRMLEQAEESYYADNDEYASLDKLIEANELNSSWSSTSKMGYRFRVVGDKTSYEIFANPESYGSGGKKSFYVKFKQGDNRTGIHQADKGGADANINDPVIFDTGSPDGVPGGIPAQKDYPSPPPPPPAVAPKRR
ncbi:MAG TPA: DUF4190 domain-containing protein [Blastocatellia bacterium]|nr:DUF4190 domain-containing protein [Blastocatellia bacterium]